MQPPFIEQPRWRNGCHKLKGSHESGSVYANWNLILNLSNWDDRRHTFDAELTCPEDDTRCFNNNGMDGEVRKLHCDVEREHCHMELNIHKPTEAGAPFHVKRIYGNIRNINMDYETLEGRFSTPMIYLGHQKNF